MNIKVNGYDIKVKVINNKMKWTLLSVHGLNSSMDFTHGLDNLDNNFNHIKVNLPIEGNISIEGLNKIVKELIEKHINSKYLILLGHSLGGVHVIDNAQSNMVKKLILIAPFNPSVYKPANILLAKSVLGGSMIGSLIKSKASNLFPGQVDLLDAALDENKPYKNIIENKLLNKDYITELDNKYRDNNKESLYIIGSKDMIINSKDFKSYVDSLDKELHFVQAGHNPFKDDLEATHELINKFIPRRKKLFKRNIFKA